MVLKRNIWVHPFHEEDPRGLIELVGVDRVVFGSDYPHIEGMSEPLTYVDELEGLLARRHRQGHGRQPRRGHEGALRRLSPHARNTRTFPRGCPVDASSYML